MESKALDKSIAMKLVTSLESTARRQSSTILTKALKYERPTRNLDIFEENRGWKTS